MKLINNKNIEKLFSEKIKILSDFERNYPENPDDLIASGVEYNKNGYDIYQEIANDEKLHGVECIIRRSILSAPFDIQYTNEKNNDEEIISFIKNNISSLDETTFKSVLSNLLDARIFGFKICEKVFQYIDGNISIKKIKSLPCDYFDFQIDDYGNLENVIIYTDNKSEKVIIPKNDFFAKFIIFTYPYKKDGNYYGQSAYKCLYEVWRKKKRLSLMAPLAYELRFIPPIKTVYDTTLKNHEVGIKDVARNIKNNSHINIPALRNEDGKLEPIADIEFLKGGDADFNSIINQIEAYNIDMSRSLGLPDDLGFSTTKNGSNAKSKTQLELFYDLIVDEQSNLENIISEQLIKQLVNINFGEQKTYPKFRFIRNNFDEMISRVDYIAKLRDADINVKDDWIESFLDIPLERNKNPPHASNFSIKPCKTDVISKIVKGYLPRIKNILTDYISATPMSAFLPDDAIKNTSYYILGIIIRSFFEGIKSLNITKSRIDKKTYLENIQKELSLNTKAIKVFREYLNEGIALNKPQIEAIKEAKNKALNITNCELVKIFAEVTKNISKTSGDLENKSYINSRDAFDKALKTLIEKTASSYYEKALSTLGDKK